jgi:hypothetical protein
LENQSFSPWPSVDKGPSKTCSDCCKRNCKLPWHCVDVKRLTTLHRTSLHDTPVEVHRHASFGRRSSVFVDANERYSLQVQQLRHGQFVMQCTGVLNHHSFLVTSFSNLRLSHFPEREDRRWIPNPDKPISASNGCSVHPALY